MKINKLVLTEDTYIRLGTSYTYRGMPQLHEISGIYGGGEPIVLVPAGTELYKLKTEYYVRRYAQSLEDFSSLLKKFPKNVRCKSRPGTWEGVTMEEKYPEYGKALVWTEIPFTDDWREDEDDLGDFHF